MSDPFLTDMTGEIRWALIGIALLALWIFREQRAVWFGASWSVVTVLPSLFSVNQTIFDRYLYLPSIGLALVLASILTALFHASFRPARLLSPIAVGILLFVYATGLYSRNAEWGRAAQITQAVMEQVQELHPTVPSDAQLVFVNVPVLVGGRQMQAFGNMLPTAMQILYRNPNLNVLKPNGFPVGLAHLDRTFFFEYNRRKITERVDLIQALEQRDQCLAARRPRLAWIFSQDAQGWESWHDLRDFQSRDGLLVMHATGDDPYIASPEISIPTMEIGDIEIMMKVRSDRPMLTGELFWLAASQQDFAPDLRASFIVQADGELRAYHVDIATSGKLLLDDKIVRLRLDPTDAPADIAIKMITIYVHCDALQNQLCSCNTK